MSASAIAIPVHMLAAVAWVGGMFFAYMILRPALAGMEPPQRLVLWQGVFDHFFPWAWAAAFLLPMTGYWMVQMDMGGFRNAGLHVHIMHGLGILMLLLLVYLYGSLYRRFVVAVAAGDWPAAGARIAAIRRIVGINLILGIVTIVIGSSGRLW